MTSIPLLVCCDAGAAGRELLARRDMILRWALTPAEAKSVIAIDPPWLVLVREDMAGDVLRETPAGLPVVVLLEPDGWVRHECYAEAGATALVRASNRERILEAVSELTGIPFRVYPRVPLTEVLNVEVDGEAHYLEAVEISASGIAVRNLPGARVGTRVMVDLDFLEPARRLSAIVVRFGQDDGQPLAGLTFNALHEDDRKTLVTFIREREAMLRLPEPENLTADLGPYTLDLFAHVGDDMRMFKDMLTSAMFPLDGAIAPRMPSWMQTVARSLTPLEQEALKGAQSPPFGSAAVELRLALAHGRAGAGGTVTPAMAARVLDFARTLANEGTGQSPKILHQIAEIRAALLVSAYADHRVSPLSSGRAIENVGSVLAAAQDPNDGVSPRRVESGPS